MKKSTIYVSSNKWLTEHPLLSIVLYSLAAYLSFIAKLFHIDDVSFLSAARAINSSPLHPFSVPVFYDFWKEINA
ncbi:MAG TPA: hypothetical protein DEE98_01970 [Elusimicrobia bacterium]|nr:MAG: hypothetical protein A2278_05770 [Elusimicrobia bacterium RIFOXYA12_FULL_49_49]OGS07252.1 MAG: hypothetical protein A2204_04920 [Elusimicrobia bacterium RIFOXYA1_FULL_47_7]OGS15416.1 MAG: hypothetical protein A2251_07600 [Elusimicrobia bacterium RIFOXYA2_FULL_47_53]OGS30844.1 MAG: hypothetical protein A2323_00740 [Elusimicrobia bacterium RIFOXYB2_FULL_46_23]HBU69130.1 hypothetical protein [Elusimicrobiota bacterium]